ncbi:XkdQ/YqbQ family protein [Oceanirhabdus sp. W0125-5]|uniref:XkdQ/YqbQ family protein n=1 Tax=Oceanirhabdus sp. W0125-5 TaxID=2999116 RepID=UPI0022F2DDE8|nr:hypothetical protein [Oceanirhabdus sp. W0125-5]WBW96046.1 hypothetical protein OW730_20480 [Oceanirhabdus sp. W0125-5]
MKIFALYESGESEEITSFCSSMDISGSVEQCARKLSIRAAFPIHDPNHGKLKAKAGTIIYVQEDNGDDIFKGIVFTRDISSSQEITLMAYDFLIYLLKSNGTYNFQKASLSSVMDTVCGEAGLSVGSTPGTSVQINRIFQNESLFSIIKKVLNDITLESGVEYVVNMKDEKVNIQEKGEVVTEITVDYEKNLLSTSFSDSIEDMINTVKVFDEKGECVSEEREDDWINKYGIFQETYEEEEGKNSSSVAKNMMKGLQEKLSVSILGNSECISGSSVKVKIPYIGEVDGREMYIESDTHTWDFGACSYTTNLSLVNKIKK